MFGFFSLKIYLQRASQNLWNNKWMSLFNSQILFEQWKMGTFNNDEEMIVGTANWRSFLCGFYDLFISTWLKGLAMEIFQTLQIPSRKKINSFWTHKKNSLPIDIQHKRQWSQKASPNLSSSTFPNNSIYKFHSFIGKQTQKKLI